MNISSYINEHIKEEIIDKTRQTGFGLDFVNDYEDSKKILSIIINYFSNKNSMCVIFRQGQELTFGTPLGENFTLIEKSIDDYFNSGDRKYKKVGFFNRKDIYVSKFELPLLDYIIRLWIISFNLCILQVGNINFNFSDLNNESIRKSIASGSAIGLYRGWDGLSLVVSYSIYQTQLFIDLKEEIIKKWEIL